MSEPPSGGFFNESEFMRAPSSDPFCLPSLSVRGVFGIYLANKPLGKTTQPCEYLKIELTNSEKAGWF